MYSISQNSPLYGKNALLKVSQSIMETTNQQWVDLLTMLHRSGKTKISDMAYVFEMKESQLSRILTQLEREGLVVTTNNMVDITSKGRRWVEKENPMIEERETNSIETTNNELDEAIDRSTMINYYGKLFYAILINTEGGKNASFQDIENDLENKRELTIPSRHIPTVIANAKREKYIQQDSREKNIQQDKALYRLRPKAMELLKSKYGDRLDFTEETKLDEAIDRSTMQSYYGKLFYAILTNSERGGKSATLQDIENDLENTRELMIPSKHIPVVLAKAEREGYIQQDGAAYKLTQKAMQLLRSMEESMKITTNKLSEARMSNTDYSKDIQSWVQKNFDKYWEKEIEEAQRGRYRDDYEGAEVYAGRQLLHDLRRALEDLMGGKIDISWSPKGK